MKYLGGFRGQAKMTEKLHFIGAGSIPATNNSFLHFAKTAFIRFETLIKVVPHIFLRLYTKNWKNWRLFEIFTLVPLLCDPVKRRPSNKRALQLEVLGVLISSE